MIRKRLSPLGAPTLTKLFFNFQFAFIYARLLISFRSSTNGLQRPSPLAWVGDHANIFRSKWWTDVEPTAALRMNPILAPIHQHRA